MKAVIYDAFGTRPRLDTVADPQPTAGGAVIEVKASGVCRSDWHGWQGHDPDITLPHVPGHEFAGIVRATGRDVLNWKDGDRVTLPFVCGCGSCPQCASGNQQVCDRQFQPGFTHWGSFAQYVAVDYADANLVRLPETLDFVTAAGLGCRFATAFRGVCAQGRVVAAERVAVYGCGGVGLSAIMIASALGAEVVAIDIVAAKLDLARAAGATGTVNATSEADVVAAVRALCDGGAHVSIDALGSPTTCYNAIASLRKRGRHVQVGLLTGAQRNTAIPMDRVVANELEILGSHGMQAHAYPPMLEMIRDGRLQPQRLIGRRVALADAVDVLVNMQGYDEIGMAIIDRKQ